ncbi:MAG: hypothetical protein ChlgKO_02950 [Chlamydiales bacterium]
MLQIELINAIEAEMLTFTEMIRKYSVRYHGKMKNLTQPLLDHFAISYFSFFQVTNDGRLFFIANDIEWNEFSFSQKEITANNPFTISPELIREGLYTSELQNFPGWDEAIKFIQKNANFDTTVCLFQKTKDGYIVGGFGFSSLNFHLANRFTSDVHAINAYLSFFIEESFPILKKSDVDAIDLNTVMGEGFHKPRYFMRDCSHIKQAFYKTLGSGKVSVSTHLIFTERERECLSCCFDGLTSAEIGKKLFLSQRTIEHRIEQIKIKLGCSKKSEIITAVRALKEQGRIIF